MVVKTKDIQSEVDSKVGVPNKMTLLIIIFLTWTLGSFDKVAINVVAIPLSAELGFDPTQIGLIMSSFFLSYAVMNFFGGILADRFGYKKIMIITILFWSIFTGITGLLSGFAAFLVVRFLFGMSEGAFPPSGSVAIAQEFPKHQRGRAKAFLLSASILGFGLGITIVSTITEKFNWRMSFYIFSVLGILALLSFYLCIRRTWGKTYANSQTSGNKLSMAAIIKVLKIPLVWKLTVIYFGCGVVNWGLTSWLPTYWVKEMGLDLVTMGTLQLLPPLAMVIFMQVAGYMLDKFMVGRESFMIIGSGPAVIIFTYLMFQAKTVPLALTYQTLIMISMAFIGTTVFALPLKYLPQNVIGSATGLINFGQQMAGAVAPALMGFMIAKTGSYDMVCLFVIIIMCITTIFAFFLKMEGAAVDD